MSILLTKDTRFIIQGITGREAINLTRENLDYGAKIVGGVTPGRAGRDVYGVPVFDSALRVLVRNEPGFPVVLASAQIPDAGDFSLDAPIMMNEAVFTGEARLRFADSETSGAQGNVVYSAVALPGGLDRIRIFKRDLDNDRCTWVVLVSPAIAGMYPVMTPGNWSVESISISDVGMACDSDNPAMFGSEPATAAVGDVMFGMMGAVYPCEVDIDVTADFAGILPGIPAQDTLTAAAVPVTGC